jgi:conjugative transfer signal peptidase TraF
MKPIIAGPGDSVKVSRGGITVNSRLIANTAAKQKDSRGRPMYPWATGEYMVPEGFVWVASSYNDWSFDSRYFGPLPVALIRSRLTPLLTF